MTEVSFAKSFLATLDTLPTKLSADYVGDPRNYPARSAYFLPKMPHAFTKRQKLAPGQERSIRVTVKSLRNPPLDVTLPSQPPSTSVLYLKEELSVETGIPLEKLKLLYKKKPLSDSKALKDFVSEDERNVELSVMVLGGVASVGQKDKGEDKIGQENISPDVCGTEEFWTDLRAYLVQRLKDEAQGDMVFGIFKGAWASRANQEEIGMS